MNQWVIALIMKLLDMSLDEEVMQEIKIKIVAIFKEFAAKTDNKIDDELVKYIAMFLGVPED